MCSVAPSCPSLCDPWTVAHQAPLSMGFSRKNTGVGCYFLLQGNLPDSVIEPISLMSPALAGSFFTTCHLGRAARLRLLQQKCEDQLTKGEAAD